MGLIDRFLPLGWGKVVLEGVLKIALFVGYLFLCTRMKEIHRVFEYHGAEHKTIACYEAGEELTVENVRHHRRFHPRCGTSFMILVLIVSICLLYTSCRSCWPASTRSAVVCSAPARPPPKPTTPAL